jgi:hypothetical protein
MDRSIGNSPARRRRAALRFSLLVLLLAVALAAAVLGWTFYRHRHSVEAYVHIVADPDSYFLPDKPHDEASYQRYVRANVAFVTSPMILEAALMRSEVAALSIVKRHEDPVEWLKDAILIDFPDTDDVMRLRLFSTRKDMSEECTLLDAILELYVERVATERRVDHAAKREALRSALTSVQRQLSSKSLEYDELRRASANTTEGTTLVTATLKAEIEALKRVAIDLEVKIHQLRLETEYETRDQLNPNGRSYGAPLRIIQPARQVTD